MCWCKVRRAKFRAATGFDLPRSDDHDDDVTRAYAVWDAQVNMTNPMAMKGLYREILPAGPYVATMTLPPGTKPASVMPLESGKPAEYRRDGAKLIVEVPRIALHEAVAVALA